MNLTTAAARNCVLAGLIVLFAPLSLPAFPPADGPPGAHGPCGSDFRGPAPGALFDDDRPPPYLMELTLSEDQQDRIFAISHAAAPALREQAKAARKACEQLHDLGRTVPFDDGLATTMAQALGKAEGQLMLLRARLEHEILAVLTAEQRARIADLEHAHDRRALDGPPARP